MTRRGLQHAMHAALISIYRRLPRRLRIFGVRLVSPSFLVGSVCVVERSDGAVLLLRNSYRDGWGLPGGLLHRGETAHEAVHREVCEEVGIDIELLGPPDVWVDGAMRRVDVIFRARAVSASEEDRAAPVSAEITEARWFRPGELPAMQKEASQALRVACSGRGQAP